MNVCTKEAFDATEERKSECRAFVSSLSSTSCFEDDVWDCDKRRRDASEQRWKLRISFKGIPVAYRDTVKYYTVLQLIDKAGVLHTKTTVRGIAKYLAFLGQRRLEDTDIAVGGEYRHFLDEQGLAESTKQTMVHAVSDFFFTMNGFDGMNLRNPFAYMDFSCERLHDYKYIPDDAAKQLDRIFRNEEIQLHLRCIYWILRLIPSRISEVLGMKLDCLKPYDDHDCLLIPTWKQNGGYKQPIIRTIHLGNGETENYLKSLIREQQKRSEIYQEYVPQESRGLIFTYRQQIELDGKVYDKNNYRVATWTTVSHAFKKLCKRYGVTDKEGNAYCVTSHQFRHNGITDRLRAGFTPTQISDMTEHHGDAMMLASYAHLNLFPETIPEPIEYRTDKEVKPEAVLFCGKIINLNGEWEKYSLNGNIRSHRIPGGICSDVTHCKSGMWNCIECESFIPEAEQLTIFEEQAREWERKALKFSHDSELQQTFRHNADNFRRVIERIKRIKEKGSHE